MAKFLKVLLIASFVLVAGAEQPYGYHPAPPPQDLLEHAPSVTMEYKVFVDGGREDCYYQYVHHDANLFIHVQVIKGDYIGMTVRNPDMEDVYPYMVTASSEYEEENAKAGYYSVCLDNRSSFSTKLVNIFLSTFRKDLYIHIDQELQDMDVTVQNFTTTFKSVEQEIQQMRRYQTISKERKGKDFRLVRDNLRYIKNWSLLQCTLVILCTTVQVYFVRNLFKDPRDTNGIKTRT